MPTKKELKKSLISYKGLYQHIINILFDLKAEIRLLNKKLEYREKQIAYLVKKAYPKTKYTPLEQEILIKRYFKGQNARIPAKGTCSSKSRSKSITERKETRKK